MEIIASPSIRNRTAVLTYDTHAVKIKLDVNNNMRWVFENPDGEVLFGTEKVSYRILNEYLHGLTWVEEDGLTVNQILDFSTGTIKSIWILDAEIKEVEGTFQVM